MGGLKPQEPSNPGSGGGFNATILVPKPVVGGSNSAEGIHIIQGNTAIRLSKFDILASITVSKVSFNVKNFSVGGTFSLAFFSEDGQKKIYEEIITVASAGLKTITLTTPFSLPAGSIYIVTLANGVENMQMTGWVVSLGFGPTGRFNSPVGLSVLNGTLVAGVPGTLPENFDPTGITPNLTGGEDAIALRLE